MRKNIIEREAYRIYCEKGGDSEANWLEAEGLLSVFPKEKRTIPYNTYLPSSNAYALEIPASGKINWQTCRETFERYWIDGQTGTAGVNYRIFNRQGHYFCCSLTHGGSVLNRGASAAKFIRETEHILKLDDVSKFQLTDKKNIIWIVPAPFWSKQSMRFSLWTLLLRCGLRYELDGKSYNDAISSYKYGRETKAAIDLFMTGKTSFIGTHNYTNGNGWRDMFKESHISSIRTHLK